MDITVEQMKKNHLDEVLRIESLCFSDPWSRESFEYELDNDANFVVALEDDKVVGFGGFYHVLDEADITNIAVHPNYRRKHIATAIVEHLLSDAEKLQISIITLEVRRLNANAISLYKKYGFEQIAVRKGYYSNPVEDALIMQLHMQRQEKETD